MTRKNKQKRKEINQPVSRRATSSVRWGIALAIVAILAFAGIVGLRFFQDAQRQAALASLSDLNLSAIEPQVVSKIQKLREDVKNNPRSAAAWGKLAMNLDAHDFKKGSIPVYKEAAALDSSDFRWPYFTSIVFAKMGEQEALEWFERARKIKPDYVPMLVNYGDALFQFGKNDRAAQQYRQALDKDPKCPQALFGLARIFFAQGDMENSRKNLQKALESNPSYGEAYNLLVSVCRRMKDSECVAHASEMAARITEKTQLPDPVYAELVAEGESSIWYRFRGSNYFKKGLYDAAIAEFQTALHLRPDAQSHEDLAQALSSNGKFSEAAEHYRAAIAVHPTANNYFGLALALAKMGQYAEAEKLFRKAIELKRDFAEAYFNLAVLNAKAGRLQETLENLKQAVRINPDYIEAHYHLGQAYLAAKNLEAATQEYKILTNLDPNTAKRLQMLMQKQK